MWKQPELKKNRQPRAEVRIAAFLSARVLEFLIACLAITICLFVLTRVSVQPAGRSDDLPDHTHYRLSLRGTGR